MADKKYTKGKNDTADGIEQGRVNASSVDTAAAMY